MLTRERDLRNLLASINDSLALPGDEDMIARARLAQHVLAREVSKRARRNIARLSEGEKRELIETVEPFFDENKIASASVMDRLARFDLMLAVRNHRERNE